MLLFLLTRPNPEDCRSWCGFQEGSMSRSLLMRWNPIRFFAYVRRNRRLKQRIMALRADDGAVLTDSQNVARILGNCYASVYRTDEGRDQPSLPEPSTIMNAPRFTSAAVHKELSALYTAKGSGPDDLHPFMLQFLADFLAEPITALYNKSLQSGEVPQDCRKAIICPIFKKGDPEDAANYRPVSLTSVLCKIFEKLLKKALFWFLT